MARDSPEVKAAKAKIQEGFQEYLEAKGYTVMEVDEMDWMEDEEKPDKPIPLMLTDTIVIGHQLGFIDGDDTVSAYPFLFGTSGATLPQHVVKGLLMHILDQLDC